MKKKIAIIIFIVICIILEHNMVKNYNNQQTYVDFITIAELQMKLDNKENITVYFFKDDCIACLRFKPTINKVLKKYGYSLYAINLSEESMDKEEIALRYNIFKTPTLITFIKGEEIKRNEGAMSEKHLSEFFKHSTTN